MSITNLINLLEQENNGLLTRISNIYNSQNKLSAEYKTVENPIPNVTECLKRSFSYDINNNIVGSQVKVLTWTTSMENLVSPPITNITLTNLNIINGLPSGTKIADIIVTGGVLPIINNLTSNPGNLFRIDNNYDLVLNSPSTAGTYPITIQSIDDDGKIASQNFNIIVAPFTNTYSLNFDGVDEYIDFGFNNDIKFDKTSQFSVSGWIKLGTVTAGTSIIGNFGTLTSPRGWRVVTGISGFKNIGLQLSNSSTNQIITHSTSTYTDGLWHNFVVTYDGSSTASGIIIYIDGVSVSTTLFSNTLTLTPQINNNLRVASSSDSVPTQLFNGNVDEIAIWNKVLNSSEVSEIYNSGHPHDLLAHSANINLIHYYRMESFPTVPDQKGSNNGTTFNMEALDLKTDVP